MPCPPHLFAPFRPPGWSPGRTISRSVSPAWTTKRTLTGVAQPGQQRELLSLQNKDPLQNNKETPSRAAQPAPLRELRGCALCPRFVLRSRRGVCVCVRAQTSGLSWARAARRSRLAAWPGTSRRWCRSAFSPNGGAKEMDDAHPCPTPPALSSLLVPHQHTRRWRQRDGCSPTLSTLPALPSLFQSHQQEVAGAGQLQPERSLHRLRVLRQVRATVGRCGRPPLRAAQQPP